MTAGCYSHAKMEKHWKQRRCRVTQRDGWKISIKITASTSTIKQVIDNAIVLWTTVWRLMARFNSGCQELRDVNSQSLKIINAAPKHLLVASTGSFSFFHHGVVDYSAGLPTSVALRMSSAGAAALLPFRAQTAQHRLYGQRIPAVCHWYESVCAAA